MKNQNFLKLIFVTAGQLVGDNPIIWLLHIRSACFNTMDLQGLRDLNHGRLISFFILVVLLGSLQLWVLMIVLKALDQPIELKRLLGDGGLFFFSTSLAIGSAVTLWDQKSTPFGGEDFLITLLLPGGIFFLTTTWTVAIMAKDGLKVQYPFDREESILLQLSCTFAAICYWFYTGIATDMFKRNRSTKLVRK